MKKKREAESENYGEVVKRRKAATIFSITEELNCPITHVLPVNPVTAADGYVYEKEAIARWLKQKERKGEMTTSPVTNNPMESTLLSAVQVRNTIIKIIESGTLDPATANEWLERNERVKEESRVYSERIETSLKVWNELADHVGMELTLETWELPPDDLFVRILAYIPKNKRKLFQTKYNECKTIKNTASCKTLLELLFRIAEKFLKMLGVLKANQ